MLVSAEFVVFALHFLRFGASDTRVAQPHANTKFHVRDPRYMYIPMPSKECSTKLAIRNLFDKGYAIVAVIESFQLIRKIKLHLSCSLQLQRK